MPQEPDYDKMSTEELRDHALRAFMEAPVAEQPRDEHGRFVKPEPEVVETPQEVDEVVYRREIDLGDGSGKQVFEGETLEDLIDKLADAQLHATRKIREQAQELKSKAPAPKVEDEQPTEVDRFLRQQQYMQDPDKMVEAAARKLLEKEFAPKLAKIEAIDRERHEHDTSAEWVASNPDFYATPTNGKKMVKWLQVEGLDVTPENLSKAFEDLNADGLLVSRPTETGTENEVETQETRIAQPTVATTVRRKVVGGLSTKRSAPVETRPSEPTEDELRKMPMEELEQLVRRSLMS